MEGKGIAIGMAVYLVLGAIEIFAWEYYRLPHGFVRFPLMLFNYALLMVCIGVGHLILGFARRL